MTYGDQLEQFYFAMIIISIDFHIIHPFTLGLLMLLHC